MTGSQYGRAFAAWREATPEWETFVRHPFVAGLGDGTLPRDNFLHYLEQDYLFLGHFARAWALGVVKAETLDEMRACAETVDALVNQEMRMHVQTCAEAGISESRLMAAEEAPENMAYTRYVLEAGFSGDFLDLMAALVPCVLGYGEIGARLADEASAPTYRGWIDTYAGRDYQRVCCDVGSLIDAAIERRLGADFEATPRWARLGARFASATRLEVGFWEMGMRPG